MLWGRINKATIARTEHAQGPDALFVTNARQLHGSVEIQHRLFRRPLTRSETKEDVPVCLTRNGTSRPPG